MNGRGELNETDDQKDTIAFASASGHQIYDKDQADDSLEGIR
jgi:hypothetical protein